MEVNFQASIRFPAAGSCCSLGVRMTAEMSAGSFWGKPEKLDKKASEDLTHLSNNSGQS